MYCIHGATIFHILLRVRDDSNIQTLWLFSHIFDTEYGLTTNACVIILFPCHHSHWLTKYMPSNHRLGINTASSYTYTIFPLHLYISNRNRTNYEWIQLLSVLVQDEHQPQNILHCNINNHDTQYQIMQLTISIMAMFKYDIVYFYCLILWSAAYSRYKMCQLQLRHSYHSINMNYSFNLHFSIASCSILFLSFFLQK